MGLNLAFFSILVWRRIIRKRFFSEKQAAQGRFRKPVDTFALGQSGMEQTHGLLGPVRSPAEREALAEMLFAASGPENTDRVSELLFRLGLVEEWARIAFARKMSKTLLGVFLGREEEPPAVRWPKLLRPLYRARFTAVSRALALNNLGHLSPRYARHFLTAALSDPSSQVRRVAIEGLGRGRDPAAIPLLVEELRKAVGEGNDLSLRSLKVALIRFPLQALESFLPYLTDSSRRCRFFVTDTIRQICDLAAAKSRLTKKDFSPALYRAVVEQCQYDEFEDVRARSCYIARHFRDDNATEMLRRLMQDRNEFVRLHSLRAAADEFYEVLIPDVVARLTDERWLVREAAVQTLRAMGSNGRDALFQFFVGCTDRFAAEQACDEFQRRGVIPGLLLAMAAGGEEGPLADKVVRKLVSIGKTALLLPQLGSGNSFAVQIALMDALAVNPTPEFVSILKALSLHDSDQISSKARHVLNRIQSESNTRSNGDGVGKERPRYA